MISFSTNGPDATYASPPAAKSVRRAGTSVWFAGVLAFVLLISAGIAYRVTASGLQRIRDNPVALPAPLRTIPMQIGAWAGKDANLPTITKEYMKANFADDYVSRRYTNTAEGALADVYVVYCSSYPSGLLGHRPDVCYPAHGWIRDHTTPTEIATTSGQKVECLIQQFHKSRPIYQQVYVLSFYVLNGQTTLRERDFSGPLGRTPNISGDPAHYVAQVQISSTVEHCAKLAARDLVDTVLTFLPDRHGYVKAASSFGQTGAGQGSDASR